MKKLLLVIGIVAALFATSCKKDTSVSPTSGGDTPQGDKNECFYFEAVDAGAVIGMENVREGDAALNISLEYSTDKTNWSSFVVGETAVTLANIGDRVYIRAKGTNDKFNLYVDYEDYSSNTFTATSKVKVGGNIMYLLDGTGTKNNFDTLLNKSAFSYLFVRMTSLTDASSLVLPATTLAEECYAGMFEVCTSLTNAPELPATTLADLCYYSMFTFCTSLTAAPSLPATTLATYCYVDMFSDCTSLVNAPELPTTTLSPGCYAAMFFGCTSLTTAPELPATTLAGNCYYKMFSGCTSLVVNTTGPGTEWIIPATSTAEGALYQMFENTGGTMNGTPEVNTTYYIASAPSSAVDEVTLPDMMVVSEYGSIIVKGAEGYDVMVCDAGGKVIGIRKNAGDYESIKVPVDGIYFVKIDDVRCEKVVVK